MSPLREFAAISVVILSVSLSAASAEKATAHLTFAQVRQSALINSEKVKRISARLADEAAESLSSEKLQNPQVQAQAGIPFSYEGESPEEQLQIVLSQPLRVSDFGTRTEVGELIRAVASREQQRALQEFFGKLALSYNALWALQLEEKHLNEQLGWARKMASLLSAPSAAGRFSQPQRYRVDATVAKIEAELLGLRHAKAMANARLTRLSGVSVSGMTLERIEVNALPQFAVLWRSLKESGASLLQRYQIRQRLLQERLQLAREDRFSAFAPQVGYSRNEEGAHFAGVGFSVALPIFERNDTDVAQGEAKMAASSATLSYLASDEFKEEFRLLVQGAKAKRAQAQSFQERVLPALRRTLQSAESLFQNGQADLLELWTTRMEYHAALDESTTLWADALAMQLEVSVVSGWEYF